MRQVILYFLCTILCTLFSTSLPAQYSDVSPASGQSDEGALLMLPAKYDKNVVKRMFQLEGDTISSLADRLMMDTYLNHPEKVRGNEGSKEQMPTKKHESKPAILEPSLYPIDVENTLKDEEGQNDTISFVITKPHFWTFSGDYNLQFMQNYISPNWYKSGNSTYSMLGAVTLQYNYNNKQRLKWDNKLELKLSFLSTDADTVNNFKTTEDLIRYTTQLSLQAHKNWYYAAQLIANTQFTRGLKNNDATIYSDFMSPFNLNVSLGMNYNVKAHQSKLTGNILLAPLSYRMTYVDRSDLATRFGLDEGKHVRNDIGSLINAEIVWKPLDNFKWQTRLYAYTTYSNFLLEWENTLVFQFNRYISTNLFIYPRFDDAVDRTTSTYWQLKEYLSVGFTYSM